MKIKQMLGNWWSKSGDTRRRMKLYWKSLMASTHKKLSSGAASISRLISFAHKDEWRRRDK
jgi:hypothetical protein